MPDPVPILQDHWPEDGEQPSPAAPPALRMGLDDVLYDELDAPLDYFVKTFSARDELPLDFMDQAAVQCRLAKARAAHWVTVREARKDKAGYQIVLPFMPSSAQRLVSEHVRLRHHQLHAIVWGTVAGLSEINRLLKRPHGNLKPTNVLLRSKHLTPDAVALTDPAPTMRAMERGEAGDLRRLGEMIHLLILHRLPRGEGDWPIAPSREWQNLGHRGDRWRDFCNRLIDPAGPSVTLDIANRFLKRLNRGHTFARRTMLVGMAASVAVGSFGLYQNLIERSRSTPTLATAPPAQAPQTPLLSMVDTTPRRVEIKTPAVAAAPIVKIPALPPVDPAFARQMVLGAASRTQSFASAAMHQAEAWKTQWLEDRRQRAIARFIDDCSRPAVTALPEIARAIDAQNHRFADEVTGDPSRFAPGLIAERDRISNRLLLVDRILKDFPTTAAVKPTTPTGERIAKPLGQAAEKRRAAALEKAIGLAGQTDLTDQQLAGALNSLITQANTAQAEGAKLLSEVDQVTRLLGEGVTPDTPINGVMMRDLGARWASSPLYADAEIKAVVEPLTIAMSLSDPAALKQTAASRDALIGLRLAAWHSSLYPSPRSREDLQIELQTRAGLLHTAELLKGLPRYAAVTQQIAADYALRWEYFLSHAPVAADIAFALSADVRPPSLDVSKLPAAARWNAQWFELTSLLGGKRDPAILPRVHAVVTDLLRAGTALPAGTVKPDLLARLQQWNVLPPDEDLTHIGPASPESALRWTAEPDATGKTITYSIATNSDPLTFRRVTTPTGDVFVCTTETSLGAFSDIVSATSRWREVRDAKLLGGSVGISAAGPHVWQWSSRRDAGTMKSLVWLSNEWVPAGADDYPDSLGGEFNRATLRPLRDEAPETINPSRRQPMQQVSADAAEYVAKLVACRLPTPQEWKAAYADSTQMRGANLRDRTWRIELDHMTRTWPRSSGATYRPDAGMFVPAGEPQSDDVWVTAAKEEYDDGVLWFREVVAGGADVHEFQNLVGNVGEFVKDALGKIYVIGGSSMSPPTRPVDKEFEVSASDRRKGFADVGFRLAFTAPPKPLERLASILPGADAGYLVGGK